MLKLKKFAENIDIRMDVRLFLCFDIVKCFSRQDVFNRAQVDLEFEFHGPKAITRALKSLVDGNWIKKMGRGVYMVNSDRVNEVCAK